VHERRGDEIDGCLGSFGSLAKAGAASIRAAAAALNMMALRVNIG